MTIATTYTTEQTASAIAQYKDGVSVEFIAEMMGKTVRSITAKLSKEGVYVSKVKPAATRVTKAHLIAAIAAKFGATVTQLESLEKCNKEALEILAG